VIELEIERTDDCATASFARHVKLAASSSLIDRDDIPANTENPAPRIPKW